MAYEVTLADGAMVSDSFARVDFDLVHRFISEQSYWAEGRSREAMALAMGHSICFGLYAAEGAQAGFARVVSDRVTRAHLNDVFVLPAYRGRGYGRALVAAILEHPELRQVGVWTLTTRDAQKLYQGFGFGLLEPTGREMIRVRPPEGPSV